ncbi:hypothetical protein ACFC0K_37885 [Streptomyces hydrogenans]|uniref:hypothetical protein n=1 Tax=Streptomyces hydrogenans TaxID=1873719 RepID=UPI0035DEA3B9
MAATGCASPCEEAVAQRELTLDRLEARMDALQFSLRTRRTSPHRSSWRHDLHETREVWLRLADPGAPGPLPTLSPEGS